MYTICTLIHRTLPICIMHCAEYGECCVWRYMLCKTRSDQTRPGQVRWDEVKSDRVWSGEDQVHPMLCVLCSPATLHTIHYVLVQRASTTLHVCEARRDKIRSGPTQTMSVRSGGMGSDQVRSGQAKHTYTLCTRIHCILKTSIQR